MKLLFSWIWDHIDHHVHADESYVRELASRLSLTVAEVAQVVPVDWPATLGLATCEQVGHGSVTFRVGTRTLTAAHIDEVVGGRYLVIADVQGVTSDRVRRLSQGDCGSEREGLIPAVWVDASYENSWAERPLKQDFVLYIDNQAITHRPDLWSHRGWAREIAAVYGWRLREISELALPAHVTSGNGRLPAVATATDACSFISAVRFDGVAVVGSIPWMAMRLAAIDMRPLNALVDCTNYVMADVGQPLHAYDANCIQGPLTARQARTGERLELLDGTRLDLNVADVVIADDRGPCALAGIMGGKVSAVSTATQSVLLESAAFAPGAIRGAMMRHNVRTEGAVRWEKGTGDGSAEVGLVRYKQLLAHEHIPCESMSAIATAGGLRRLHERTVAHATFERYIGAKVSEEMIITSLTRREYMVKPVKDAQGNPAYHIVVPRVRGLREGLEDQDFVEEVARAMGYDAIAPITSYRSPTVPLKRETDFITALKRYSVDALGMHELQSYAMFDESWLHELGITIDDTHTVLVRNPVSLQWRRMVTTLVPHLLKGIAYNRGVSEQLACFEINARWRVTHDGRPQEALSYAWAASSSAMDFYRAKDMVCAAAERLRLPLAWEPVQDWPSLFLLDPAQSALVTLAGTPVGVVGMLAGRVARQMRVTEPVACCDIDLAALMHYEPLPYTYEEPSKFQAVFEDITVMAGAQVTVAELESAICRVDERITLVVLRDMFTKKEWSDRRALTFRVTLQSVRETLTRQQIDAVMERVREVARQHGAEVPA